MDGSDEKPNYSLPDSQPFSTKIEIDVNPIAGLPDSQPFFTEIETDFNLITGLPDSQPLFTEIEDLHSNFSLPDQQTSLTEKEEKIITQIKRHATFDVEESQSLLVLKRRRSDDSGKQLSLVIVPQSKDTQKPQEESVLPSQNSNQQYEKYQCVPCNMTNKQKDIRNEYYAKLISSELDFVEPCMRTYVYVEVLKLIHRNKYKHMPHDDIKQKKTDF